LTNIQSVFYKVYHPDGSFKIQVVGTKVPSGGGSCQAPGTSPAGQSPSVAGDMMVDAGPVTYNANPNQTKPLQGTGQLSQGAIDQIIALCRQGVKGLWYGTFDLHKFQQCGEYRVETWVTSAFGPTTTLTYYFNVPCIIKLEIDFRCLQWPALTPGQTNFIAGDNVFGDNDPNFPPLGNAGVCHNPTAKNTGNSGMGVKVDFEDLVQCSTDPNGTCVPGSVPGAKHITDFDACFGRSPETIVCIDPVPAGTPTPPCLLDDGIDQNTGGPGPNPTPGCHDKSFTFNGDTNVGQTYNQVLCANIPGKLDFSVHPPSGLPPGKYTGGASITGIPSSNTIGNPSGTPNPLTYACGEYGYNAAGDPWNPGYSGINPNPN
jgi:hypothetical protein